MGIHGRKKSVGMQVLMWCNPRSVSSNLDIAFWYLSFWVFCLLMLLLTFASLVLIGMSHPVELILEHVFIFVVFHFIGIFSLWLLSSSMGTYQGYVFARFDLAFALIISTAMCYSTKYFATLINNEILGYPILLDGWIGEGDPLGRQWSGGIGKYEISSYGCPTSF
jgi:hypothetical protein